MIKTKRSFRGKKRSVIAVTGLLVAFVFTATGCSQVPEYVNPIEWYNDTKAWITGEDSGRPGIKKIEGNSVKKATDFPKLASVPERPKTPSRSDFKKMASGLIADRASARYSDNELRAQEEIPPRARASKASPSDTRQDRKPLREKVPPTSVSRKTIEASELRSLAIPSQNRKNSLDFKNSEKSRSALPTKPLSDRSTIVSMSPPPKAKLLSKNSKSWGNGTIFAEADKFAPRFPARPGSIEDSSAVSGSVAEPILGGLPVAIVYFENSSSVLTSESKNRIRKAYKLYQNTSRGPIHVVGHASSRTPNLGQSKHQLANFNISNKRANSVVKELITLGVDPRLILMSGMSDHRPAFLEVMPAGEAGNRRAEIYFNQ